MRKGELVNGGVIEAVVGPRVVRRRRLMLLGVLVVVEGLGWGRDVGALDVGLFGLGTGCGLGLGRRVGVGDERRGPVRVVEQLAQDAGLLELGENLMSLVSAAGFLEVTQTVLHDRRR